MIDSLKELPSIEKKVAAKVLYHRGFSLRQVEKILGVSDSSVLLYSKLETPEELKQFQADLELQFKDKEQIVAAKALARMDEKISTAKITEALDIYKVMSGRDNNIAVQVNNITAEKQQKYNI